MRAPLGGSPFRVSALYVLGPPTRGLPVHGALASLTHAFLAIFQCYSTFSCPLLLLHPLCSAAAGAGLLAVLNPTAIPLAAECLPADVLHALRSGRLGIRIRRAPPPRAYNSDELKRHRKRRAASGGGWRRAPGPPQAG